MALLDNFTKAATKFGQDVSNKTKSMTETVRLNSMISDQKAMISKRYEELGRMVVKEEAVRAKAECRGVLDAIEAAEQQLRNLEQQLTLAKGAVQCANCGAAVPAGNAFCQNCGAKMAQPNQQPNGQSYQQQPYQQPYQQSNSQPYQQPNGQPYQQQPNGQPYQQQPNQQPNGQPYQQPDNQQYQYRPVNDGDVQK